MKVSVIIPVYNASAFIAEALQSALMQKEVAECIVVDDGSTDKSLEIIEEFAAKDKRIVVLHHPNRENLGPGPTRNLGSSAVTQEYIAFLDADDYWVENRFAETEVIFSENADADAVYEAREEKESGKVTMMHPQHGPEDAFLDMAPFGKNGHFSLIGLTVKSEAAKRAGLFAEQLRLTQDTEWLARLALTSNLFSGSSTRIVAYRRMHYHNSSKNTTLLHHSRVDMCFILLKWMSENNLPFNYKEMVVNVLLKYHYEQNCLGNEKWLVRKRKDLMFLKRLKRIESQAMKLPRVKYFRRLVLLLPKKGHFNFYE